MLKAEGRRQKSEGAAPFVSGGLRRGVGGSAPGLQSEVAGRG